MKSFWARPYFLPFYIFKYIYKLARFLSVKGYSVETLNGFTLWFPLEGRLGWTWVWDLTVFWDILLLVTRVDSVMFLQIPFLSECLVTLWAVEWFLTSVDSFMALHSTWVRAFVVTSWAAEWFFTNVDPFMSLQISQLSEFLITLWTAVWFFISVDSFMSL